MAMLNHQLHRKTSQLVSAGTSPKPCLKRGVMASGTVLVVDFWAMRTVRMNMSVWGTTKKGS